MNEMKKSLPSDKSLMAVLFVTVVVIFSFAQEDSRKLEKQYLRQPGEGPAVQAGPFSNPAKLPAATQAAISIR